MQNCARSFQKIRLKEKNTPDPCIRSDMKILQNKIPYLPDGWTWARGAKYVVKLGIFILVPGLHQIFAGRRAFGWLLLLLYFSSVFVASNLPYDLASEKHHVQNISGTLADIARHIAWILLLLDIRKLEQFRLQTRLFVLPLLALGAWFAPGHNPGDLNLIVENKNDLCPVFCKYDIVEYDHKNYRVDRISIGDYVLLNRIGPQPYITQVLAVASKELCERNKQTGEFRPVVNLFCIQVSEGQELIYPWLVLGGPFPELTDRQNQPVSMISDSTVQGVRLRKIGNIRDYFVLNDEVTDYIGHALMTIYSMTGLNFFGLSQQPQTE
jgi:hypothetical protein